MARYYWSESRVARLIHLVEVTHASYEEIAYELGCTREQAQRKYHYERG